MFENSPFVLLIDDELSICTGVSGLLEMDGFKADFVLNAQEGLTFIEKNPNLDIILLDVNLGTSISGIDLLGMIKERNRYVQVVMFTSEDRLDIGLECMKRGALDYLTKPFDLTLFAKIAATAVERKRIEQLRDLYFDMVIHDLKNPLQVISGAFEMLNDTLKNNATPIQNRLLEAAGNGVNQIQMIIGNVIGITCFEKKSLVARREEFDLKEILLSTVKLFDNVELKFIKEIHNVCSDKDLMIRVVSNIVSNASRFATLGSNVLVNCDYTVNNEILIDVTNTGSYIPEDLREAIFDKFLGVHSFIRSVKGQNFGLGLTFSKMAVEAMDGKIWVTGDEDIPSTTFNILIKNFICK
jgi:K+-sensing histidine kinase KdpD